MRCTKAGTCRWLDLLLWRNCERKILSGMRRKEAGAEDAAGRQLDLREVRHGSNRKILPGVRSTETGRSRRLDLLLRNCEQGQILQQLRRKETGWRTAL